MNRNHVPESESGRQRSHTVSLSTLTPFSRNLKLRKTKKSNRNQLLWPSLILINSSSMRIWSVLTRALNHFKLRLEKCLISFNQRQLCALTHSIRDRQGSLTRTWSVMMFTQKLTKHKSLLILERKIRMLKFL